MAEEIEQYEKALVLGKANQDKWFRLTKIKLKGKGVFYTIEQTLEKYAAVGGPTDGAIAEDIMVDGAPKNVYLNIDKKAKYEKDEATALFNLMKGLSDDDQALVDEYETAKTLWAYLIKKYSKVNATAAHDEMTAIQTFKWKDTTTVVTAWDTLKDHRRKLIAANPTAKTMYSDEALYMVLKTALPVSFAATVDTLDIQTGLTVDQQIQHLESKEARLARDKPTGDQDDEHANAAFRKRFGFDHNGRDGKPNTCFLCDKPNHSILDCKYLKGAKKHVAREMKKPAPEKSSSEDETPKRERPKSKSKQPAKRSSSKNYRNKGYLARSLNSDLDSESDDSHDALEVCHISRDAIQRTPPSLWPADTGASSHMSDQSILFRELIPISRRTIRVGGGVLFADYKGVVELRCDGDSCLLLPDVLYVPNLGVNLLSARRICQAGLLGSFNERKMYFREPTSGTKMITASMQDGLYIVTKVHRDYKALAKSQYSTGYAALPAAEVEEPREIDMEDLSAKDDHGLTPKELARFVLWHERFHHLGKEKIRTLHKVTTLEKAIKVPKGVLWCDVCKLTKMTNSISTVIADRTEVRLARIQCDVAGPFPVSLRGNRYFLLFIEFWTRMNWIIAMAKKSEAPGKLRGWRKTAELQVDERVKVARTDNAPELLQIVKEWTEDSGIEPQSTVVGSSHMNGPAERNIRTAEADMRATLKGAGLPMEFWDEAVESDAYVRNRTSTGPTIDGCITSPEEAWTGLTPSIDHIRKWGSKCVTWINPKTLPKGSRHDKLMDTGRIGVFVGYSPTTTKHFRVYSPELGYTTKCSVVHIDEKTKGGTLDLRIRSSKGGSQGISNEHPDRRPRK